MQDVLPLLPRGIGPGRCSSNWFQALGCTQTDHCLDAVEETADALSIIGLLGDDHVAMLHDFESMVVDEGLANGQLAVHDVLADLVRTASEYGSQWYAAAARAAVAAGGTACTAVVCVSITVAVVDLVTCIINY